MGGYKTTATSFQFVFKNQQGVKDYRVNVYNKWMNLLESESVAKRIGMGTKSLFYCSSTMFDKHSEAMNEGISRIEVSKELYTYQEEEIFMGSRKSISWLDERVNRFIESISNNLSLNHHIPFNKFWEAFFGPDGFKHTLLVHR